jgi:hypothetical protein
MEIPDNSCESFVAELADISGAGEEGGVHLFEYGRYSCVVFKDCITVIFGI